MGIIRYHWPEYLMEAAGLGVFMISAGSFAILFYHPSSPAYAAIPSVLLRSALNGLAMSLTLICIAYSDWGRQSGAHLNPAFTLSFLRLGKIKAWDAFYYVVFQFAGGLAGVLLVSAVFQSLFSGPPIRFIATLPGPRGPWVAFAAETAISFLMMSTVLFVSRHRRLGWYTPCFAAALLWFYITFEAPLSGMSMNPARSFASALPGLIWSHFWVYLTAPLLGMFSAVELHLWKNRYTDRHCAKLVHSSKRRCIFCRFLMEGQECEPAAAMRR